MNIVDLHKNKIFELCEKHEVKELYLFGSVLTEKFNESSDVDMLIQFNPIDLTKYFDNYMDFRPVWDGITIPVYFILPILNARLHFC